MEEKKIIIKKQPKRPNFPFKMEKSIHSKKMNKVDYKPTQRCSIGKGGLTVDPKRHRRFTGYRHFQWAQERHEKGVLAVETVLTSAALFTPFSSSAVGCSPASTRASVSDILE